MPVAVLFQHQIFDQEGISNFDMKKTVCFVATTPFVVNAFLRSHLLALARSYNVVLCVNVNAYPLEADLVAAIKIVNINIERKISLWADARALGQLCRILIRKRPHAVHSITPKGGLLAMLAAWIVHTPHRFHTFTGQVWVNRKSPSRFLLKIFDRLIVKMATQVFADSASQCRLLRDEGIIREGEIKMLGAGSIAGVDLARFHPDPAVSIQLREKLGTAASTCVFLFVGRLARDKGVFDLIQAFRQVAAALPGVELWVVGPDEEGLQHALQKSAVGCKAPIYWLGATSNPEHFMAAADVLLLPSYREGFGSVLIEGAACEIPAIAYRVDGVIDAVVDGIGGRLVESRKPIAMAQAMEELGRDRDLRQLLGRQARERVEREFCSQKVTKAWCDYYASRLD